MLLQLKMSVFTYILVSVYHALLISKAPLFQLNNSFFFFAKLAEDSRSYELALLTLKQNLVI